jgi:HK97 family phage prohead protease
MGLLYKKDELELRCLRASELRVEEEGKPKITGYAAMFDTWADIGGWFKESIRRGAFAKTIKEADIRALMNHDENYVLGRNKAGTLRLHEDSKGLAVEIDPVDATWSNDLLKSMKRGDISQMSFGFTVNKQEVDYDRDERVLTDVNLFDVSVVTYPAYPTTSAQVRSLFQKEKREEKKEVTADSNKEYNRWAEYDRITAKLKANEVLTEEEIRLMLSYIPVLSVPPEKHTETLPEPPEKHSDPATRRVDKYEKLFLKEVKR